MGLFTRSTASEGAIQNSMAISKGSVFSILFLSSLFFTFSAIAQDSAPLQQDLSLDEVVTNNHLIASTPSNSSDENITSNGETRCESVIITSIDVTKETNLGDADGKITIKFKDLNVTSSTYRVQYNFNEDFVVLNKQNLRKDGNTIVLEDMYAGKYYNFKIFREGDRCSSAVKAEAYQVDYGLDIYNVYREACPNTTTSCGSVGTGSDTYAAITSSVNPCMAFIDQNCNVMYDFRGRCTDFTLSIPPAGTSYIEATYQELGISRLNAARINWLICNYPSGYNNSDIGAAVWYLTGTGGSNNSYAQAAINAVTTPDGSEDFMTFMRPTYTNAMQPMVRWDCAEPGCDAPLVCPSPPDITIDCDESFDPSNTGMPTIDCDDVIITS